MAARQFEKCQGKLKLTTAIAATRLTGTGSDDVDSPEIAHCQYFARSQILSRRWRK